MNDWVLPWARIMAREKMIRSRSRIQQVRTGSSGSAWPRPAEEAALAAQGASVRASAASSSARTVPRCTQSGRRHRLFPLARSIRTLAILAHACDGQSPRRRL